MAQHEFRNPAEKGAKWFPGLLPVGSMGLERVPALPTVTRDEDVKTRGCCRRLYCPQLDRCGCLL